MADTFDDFPIIRSFDVVQDQDWSRTFTYKVGGAPVNLTGYSAEFVIFDDYEKVYTTAVSPSGVVLGGSAGTITPTISAAVTDSLNAASYHCLLWLIDGSGKRLPFLRGRWNLAQGVSA
jgi:hypothetical protein